MNSNNTPTPGLMPDACPSCYGTDICIEQAAESVWHADCAGDLGCGASMFRTTRNALIRAWNARHRQSASHETLAEPYIHVVFDGPPGPKAGRFVECETPDGFSVNAGEWHKRPDGYWELRIALRTQGGKPSSHTAGEGEVAEVVADLRLLCADKAADLIERLSATQSSHTGHSELADELNAAADHYEHRDAHEDGPEGALTELGKLALDNLDTITAALRQSSHTDLLEAETWESINQWCDDTFGPATWQRMIERAKEEFTELEASEAVEAAAIEAADVVICLCRIPGFADALQTKMAINRKRKWRLTGEGTGYHIPDAIAQHKGQSK